MSRNELEAVRREKIAISMIKSDFAKNDQSSCVNQFISHHIEVLDKSYWQEHLGTQKPDPYDVLSILELQSHWGSDSDEGIDFFDFTLPNEVTDYVISVHFDKMGQVSEICFES